MYSFATLPIKLKLSEQIGGGTTNSKPPGRIIMMSQSQTLSKPPGRIIMMSESETLSKPPGRIIMMSQSETLSIR